MIKEVLNREVKYGDLVYFTYNKQPTFALVINKNKLFIHDKGELNYNGTVLLLDNNLDIPKFKQPLIEELNIKNMSNFKIKVGDVFYCKRYIVDNPCDSIHDEGYYVYLGRVIEKYNKKPFNLYAVFNIGRNGGYWKVDKRNFEVPIDDTYCRELTYNLDMVGQYIGNFKLLNKEEFKKTVYYKMYEFLDLKI